MSWLPTKFITNITQILASSKASKVAVAVSGGADSVALLYLTHDWAKVNNVELTVFTVDHNLRPEAKREVAYVRELAEKLGHHFVELSWHAGAKLTAIQARARHARYDLISDYCAKSRISVLLTAHHADDMLETYLMKKSKKAGMLSLAPNITFFWRELWVIRPLFDIRKAELIHYLRQNNITWLEDASNESGKYERNRVRKQLIGLSAEEKSALLVEHEAMARNVTKLNEVYIQALAETVAIYKEGFAAIDTGEFNNLSDELKIAVINYVLTIISGKTAVPRYRGISKILMSISGGSFRACTISHCQLIAGSNVITIFKERSFVSHQPVILSEQVIWDNRFEVITTLPFHQLNDNYRVTSLTMEDYIRLKPLLNFKNLSSRDNNNHKKLLFTLPVIKKLEKVIAIPHISYYDDDLLNNKVQVTFKPDFISRLTHFF